MSTQLIVILAVFAVVWFFAIRRAVQKSRAIRDGKAPQPNFPIVYGAWQGHQLGTTTMEPGDMTDIERELHASGKHPKK